jgi:hypothetical protein
MVQIKRIGVKQTAKVLAVFYFLISLVFVLPMAVFTLFIGTLGGQKSGLSGATFGGLFLLLMPLVYAAIGFVMAAITAVIYNAIAKRVGGIEIELDSKARTSDDDVPITPKLSS